MKKYIPWVIIAVLILSLGVSTYLIFFADKWSGSDSDADKLEQIRPRKMKIQDVTSSSFTVVWETDSKTTGFVKYGNTSNSLSLIEQDVNGTETRTNHRITIDDLVAGKKYYFYVMSDNVAFGTDGRPLEVLTTSQL